MNVFPENCLMIGDTTVDIRAAGDPLEHKRLGCCAALAKNLS